MQQTILQDLVQRVSLRRMIERTVFFGTPEFAVPALRALAASEFRPVLVVSQPSRPAKRGQRMTEPPVVEAARELEIPFAQVEKVRDPAFLARLAELAPGVAVVVAFGQLFPKALSAVVSLSLEAQLGVSRTLLHKLTLAETPAALERQPVALVTWDAADRYCRSLGKRLPTEA